MNTFFASCLLALVASAIALPTVQKCKLDDNACIAKSAQNSYTQILGGISELGVESSDPLFLESVDADVAGLKYEFTDTTIKGFKNCEIKNVKLNLPKDSLHYDLFCPLDIAGKYDISGRLLILPVNGKGDFTIKIKKVRFMVDADLKQTQKDGKNYVTMKSFKLSSVDAVETVVFDFKNLFNGNKQLSDGFHTFANSNYQEVTKTVSSPVFYAAIKKITKNVNKYLKAVSFDELTA